MLLAYNLSCTSSNRACARSEVTKVGDGCVGISDNFGSINNVHQMRQQTVPSSPNQRGPQPSAAAKTWLCEAEGAPSELRGGGAQVAARIAAQNCLKASCAERRPSAPRRFHPQGRGPFSAALTCALALSDQDMKPFGMKSGHANKLWRVEGVLWREGAEETKPTEPAAQRLPGPGVV